MPLLKQFQDYITSHDLFHRSDKLLLTVSGGVDSVVLCELCHKAGYNFAIAHCNFKLREQDSDMDEQFVKQLATLNKVDFFSASFDTEKYASENKLTIQVAARELRYNWFHELLKDESLGLKYILTAHHANDNIETVLMNFFKGTGISGMIGILPKSAENNVIVRPLLFAKKEELLQYASENQILYREDASNGSNKYTRNYFRNELIPSIQKVYPQVENNLLENIERFSDVNIIYRKWIAATLHKLIVEKKGELFIPVRKLIKINPLATVVYEIVKEFGFTPHQVAHVLPLLESESGKYIDSSSHRILRNREWLIISKIEDREEGHFLIEQGAKEIVIGKLVLELKYSTDHAIVNDPDVAMLDASGIVFPLLIRKWKSGDYFYPLGMNKKKKLSRFFGDMKISLMEKEKVWVIESNKKIVWIVGHRIDNRFKITGNTTKVLIIRLSSS